MKKTFKMNDVITVLRSDWGTAQEKVPELAKEILSYYAHKWNEGKEEHEIKKYIQLVWDGRLSSPSYPFGEQPWSGMWEKVKVWYIASILEKEKNWLKGKQDIWLVWDVDITKGETSLRAVTTTIEKAEKYKKSIEETHKRFDNHQFMVDIEPRDTNHLYGISVLRSVGVEYKKS